LPARNAEGVVLGQEVLKLDQNGKVLMMLGKMGVGGSGTDTFDRPTGVAIAANGDIFVSDGHGGNASNNGRVVKFSKDGRFIKTWGHKGSAPGDFDDPHDIFVGGSLGRVYVADRLNSRIQVFDQDGNFVTAWHQFGGDARWQTNRPDADLSGVWPRPARPSVGRLESARCPLSRQDAFAASIMSPFQWRTLARCSLSIGRSAAM
jgi:DNA-binding beta-propeller fold protein YncE